MIRFLLFLCLFFSVKGFSYQEYAFCPEGTFKYVSENHGPYYVSSFTFSKATIRVPKEEGSISLGSIEKFEGWVPSYVFKVGEQVLSIHTSFLFSCGTFINCFKEFDVQDAEGKLLGFIKGTFSEFLFYDEKGCLFAKVSVIPLEGKVFVKNDNNHVVVLCERVSSLNCYFEPEYFWVIKQLDDSYFDTRFLWPFMGFVSEMWWR